MQPPILLTSLIKQFVPVNIRDTERIQPGSLLLTCRLGWQVSFPSSHRVTYFFFHSLLSALLLRLYRQPCFRGIARPLPSSPPLRNFSSPFLDGANRFDLRRVFLYTNRHFLENYLTKHSLIRKLTVKLLYHILFETIYLILLLLTNCVQIKSLKLVSVNVCLHQC